MDLTQQDEAQRLLKEGSRLFYTVAAGQAFELGDINAWFEQYNALASTLGPAFQDEHYGAIGARTTEVDPLINSAQFLLSDLATRSAQARDDFQTATDAARQGGGGQ